MPSQKKYLDTRNLNSRKSKKNKFKPVSKIQKNITLRGGSGTMGKTIKNTLVLESEIKNLFERVKDAREDYLEEYFLNIKNHNICNETHEHTIDCSLHYDSVNRYYQNYLNTDLKSIKYMINRERKIRIEELDSLQEKIINLFFIESSDDDTEFMALLEYTQMNFAVILKKQISDLDLGKKFKIFNYYINIIDLYQDICNYCLLNRVIEDKQGDIELEKTKNDLMQERDSGNISANEYAFRTGVVERDLDYIGTFYEEDYVVKDVAGIETPILVSAKPRDIYLIDYAYKNLLGTKNSKMPLYRSTGSNFSSQQSGLLSPFNGFALSEINSIKCEPAEEFFVQLGNILDINRTSPSPSKIKKFFISCTGRTYTENDIKIEKFEAIENLNMSWLIKMSPSLGSKKKSDYMFINDNYNKFKQKKRKAVIETLGMDYYKEQLRRGNITFTNIKKKKKSNFFSISHNPLSLVIESIIDPSTQSEMTSIFKGRYFYNKDYYSFRNMAPTHYQKPIRKTEYELNRKIQNRNIFGENLGTYSSEKEFKSPNIEIIINRKIMAYFYENYCFSKDKRLALRSVDLKNVLDIYHRTKPSNPFTLQFNPNNSYYNYGELSHICDILKKIARNILTVGAEGNEYEKTKFYTFIKLPLYESLKREIH